MNISLIGNSALRIAIQRNLVSFPAQIPSFVKRPGDNTQQRIAYLYFGRGWPVRNICARYGLGRALVQRLVSEWRIRAVAAGYIQDIHSEDLDLVMQVKDDAEWSVPANGEAALYPQDVRLPAPEVHVMLTHTSV